MNMIVMHNILPFETHTHCPEQTFDAEDSSM